MIAPFYEVGFFGDGWSLVVAVIIGMAFGWFLERGGMGNARKLAAQFYLTDMTVFKMLFTAVVTAMLGIFWLGTIGFLVGILAVGEVFPRIEGFYHSTSAGTLTLPGLLHVSYPVIVAAVAAMAVALFLVAEWVERRSG